MTQLELARKGRIGSLVQKIARDEKVPPEYIIESVAKGEIVIPHNSIYKLKCGKGFQALKRPCGIGKGLRTKVNSNIGSSSDCADFELECQKAKVSELAGADTIMDLSTGGDLKKFRSIIRQAFNGPLGTVPIYEAAIRAAKTKKGIVSMTADNIFQTIEQHAKDGVDFITVHCGVTQEVFRRLKNVGTNSIRANEAGSPDSRIMGVVSRGASFLLTWMVANNKENPLYEHFDRLLDIAHKYDLTLSLGDGFRPGSIVDSTDKAQIQELIILGELKERANARGVQVMIEGPGHIPLNEIETNILLEKKLCRNAPFYVLGPIVTDIAPGYDEITSAIGGAIASAAGADYLCYVTPSEHLALPTIEDVKRGIIATRIAAHAGDIAKGIKGAKEKDREFSIARKNLDWTKQIALSIDPEAPRKIRKERKSKTSEVCTMCGKYCAIKLVEKALRK